MKHLRECVRRKSVKLYIAVHIHSEACRYLLNIVPYERELSTDHLIIRPQESNPMLLILSIHHDPPKSRQQQKPKVERKGPLSKKMLPSGFSANRPDRRITNNGNGNFGGLCHSARQLFSDQLGSREEHKKSRVHGIER